jgi:riboflavin biosynthesis pyrimidine reductase
MAVSLDGRIVVDGWPESVVASVRREYELVHASYDPDGWICGRVTMGPVARQTRSEAQVAREYSSLAAREDFRAPGDFDSFAFAIDPSGRLAWETNDIDGDHVVAILSDRVSDDYLGLLRKQAVSYLLAGGRESAAGQGVDLSLAMRKIASSFDVKTLMLEGGGRINGGMLAAGLIDEVSVLVAPAVDGRVGTATLFELGGDGALTRRLALEHVERRADDMLWLRYRVEAPRDSD